MRALRSGIAMLCVAAAFAACAFELPPVDEGGVGGAAALATVSASSSGSGGAAVSSASSSNASSSSTANTSSTGGGGSGSGGAGGGGDPLVEGCADGTREAYLDANVEPCIAACDGAFLVAGVNTGATCGRAGGNNGPHPDGTGCAAEDLCAAGWHLCLSSQDVSAKVKSGVCPAQTPDDRFYATRQGMDPNGSPDINCAAPPNDNNLVGCGWSMTFGQAPIGSNKCGALNLIMKAGSCAPAGTWECGDSDHEGATVVKKSASVGGVLCCRDDGAPGC